VGAGLLERRVGHHAVEPGGGQAVGRRQNVAGQDAHAVFQVVVVDIDRAKLRQGRLEFQAGDPGAGHAEGEAERRGSDSGADVEDAFARCRRRRRGQQDGVDGGAVAVTRLLQENSAIEKPVFRPCRFGR